MVAKKYNLFLTFICLGYFLNAQVRPEIGWVSIPEGTFNMGSPSTEIGRFEKEFFHQVTVEPFKIYINEEIRFLIEQCKFYGIYLIFSYSKKGCLQTPNKLHIFSILLC